MNHVGERPKEAGSCRRMTGMVRKEGKNCRNVICSILLSLVFMLFMAGNTAHSETLLPESSWDYLTEDQIPTDNYELMGFMMREILAMHGYQFEPGSNYDVYFRDTFWYYPYALDNLEAYANLSDAEWHNLELLKQMRANRAADPDNKDPMAADPLFSIGSHTTSHPYLTQISPQEKKKEISDSKAYLEKLTGKPVTALAYPYGDYDASVIAVLKEAGYKAGFAVNDRGTANEPARYSIPRIYMGMVLGENQQKMFKQYVREYKKMPEEAFAERFGDFF